MKRFWDVAVVAPMDDGLAVLLDGKPVRLPSGAVLRVREVRLAQALAGEWAAAGGAKGGDFTADDIALTRLVGTAQERIAPDIAPVVEGLAQYGGSDLLCYRADDPRLAALEAAEWDPWLDWARSSLRAELRRTTGIVHVTQPPEVMAALRDAVAAHEPMELAALGVAVPALGSLVLGLALVRGALDAAEAHRLATLDECWQEDFWGADPEAVNRRRGIAADIALAARFVQELRGEVADHHRPA